MATAKLDETQVAAETQAAVITAPFEATFAVPGLVSVTGNGDAKRVVLMTDALEPALTGPHGAQARHNAYLYAKIKLPKGTPLLPGRVYLFRDGTFAGTANLPLLQPGEDHDLGFGVDDQVKVKYAVLEEKRGETGLISTSHTDSRNFRVTLKNLHERPIQVTVLDRMPVSQNQDIKVEYTGKTPPAKTQFRGQARRFELRRQAGAGRGAGAGLRLPDLLACGEVDHLRAVSRPSREANLGYKLTFRNTMALAGSAGA